MRLGKLILALSVLLCPLAAHATACPTGYARVVALRFPHQNTAANETAYPLPVLFNGVTAANPSGIPTPTSIVLNDLKDSSHGGQILSAGLDMVPCDSASGGNLLNFSRGTYNGTTGATELYIGRDLSTSTDALIWLFIGKASDTDHSNGAAMCSASGYVLMMHGGDGSTASYTDSCGNYTPVNHSSTATTGQISGGLNFASASSQYVDVGNTVSLSTLTLEAWANSTSFSGCQRLISNLTGSGFDGYELYMGSPGCAANGKAAWQVGNSGSLGDWYYPNAVTTGTWSQFAITQTGNTVALYLNGSSQTASTPTLQPIAATTAHLNLAQFPSGGSFFNGSLDEVRISNVVKSANWIALDYNCQTTPGGCVQLEDGSIPAGMTAGAYCVPLTIAHAQVPNTDQTNFPLLVHGLYSWMADTSHGGFAVTGNSGHDIRFYSGSGCTTTALDFQRIYWLNTTGDSSFRVRVPTASHATDTTIYVRIGSTSDTADLSTLWMASYNYAGVYAGSDPATLGTADSGVANFTLGCGADAFAAASPVGGGFYFDNTQGDAATCGAAPTTVGDTLSAHGYPTGSNAGHIRMWVRNVPLTSSGGTFNDVEPGAYGKANDLPGGQRGIQMEYRATQLTGMDTLQLSNGAAGILAQNSGTTPTFVQDLNWHVYDFDQPTNGANFGATTLYIDGVPITSPVYGGGSSTSVLNTTNTACCSNVAEIRLGRMAAHGVGWFTGFVGQFEVTSFSLGADTVKARYNNELWPGGFYSFGTASPFVPAITNQPIVGFTL